MNAALETEHHLGLIFALLLIGLALCIAVIGILRRAKSAGNIDITKLDTRCLTPGHPRRGDEPNWFIGGMAAIAIVALFSITDHRDTKILREIETERAAIAAGYLPSERARSQLDLNQCPPRSDGMTDQVIMVIATHADNGPVVHGCSRIAERPYDVPTRKRVEG